jgi:hypothetical protein
MFEISANQNALLALTAMLNLKSAPRSHELKLEHPCQV